MCSGPHNQYKFLQYSAVFDTAIQWMPAQLRVDTFVWTGSLAGKPLVNQRNSFNKIEPPASKNLVGAVCLLVNN